MTVLQFDDKTKRREKLLILAEIVGVAKQGALKTHIMYKANLSFTQLNQYLLFLSNAGLLEECSRNGQAIYKTTQKGLEFLQRQQHVMDLLNEDLRLPRSVRTPFSAKY